MPLSNATSDVSTTILNTEDFNRDLVAAILTDCREAGEFSSYLTTSDLISNRSDLACEETCTVIALPGVTSDKVRPTTRLPEPVTLRREGEGTVYLELRDGQVILAAGLLPTRFPPSRYLLLYLFDDGPSLDVISTTEGFEQDIAMHMHYAESWMPDDEISYPDRVDIYQLPTIIQRNIEVTRESDAS